MDLQQLRYVVAVAETGSISAAARKLYMGQPNLSRGLRELEAELGVTLFRRTAQGAALTKSGADFLGYARGVIAQMDSLEAMFHPQPQAGTRLSVCGPRAAYLTRAFSQCLRQENRAPLQARCRELNAAGVIREVASGAARLGVVRWQVQQAAALEDLLRENAFSSETLWEFPLVVVLHERHPLAALPEIPPHLLNGYPELVLGDLTPTPPQEPPADGGQPQAGRIAVFDRSEQLDLLQAVPGCYLWDSPQPFEALARHGLVQKPCSGGGRWRDVLVRRRAGRLSQTELCFIQALRQEIAALPQI